ncbi:MAG: aconitase X swivel domain-containing protein [Candidatus Heimdallarchaeota archaeon]
MQEMKFTLKGRSVVKGITEGPALVSKQNLSLWGGLDPQTGFIIDKRHDLYREQVRDTVLVFPYGKGSTTGAIVFLEAVRCGNAPAAIINVRTEPILVSGALMAPIFYNKAIPIVDRLEKNPVEAIQTTDYVRVNGNEGRVEITRTL